MIDGGRERYLIVIDALDEAAEDGRNPLVELLARDAQRLPGWLGLLITSRPESAVTTPLQGLHPLVLDTRTEANRRDVSDYVRRQLAPQLGDRADADRLVESLLEKSEGVFLYVERVCDDIRQGNLSLERLDEMPRGLGGVFRQFFDRQFPDKDVYARVVEPLLGVILAAREPLPVALLQELFGWREAELRAWLRGLGSLFPTTREKAGDVVRPYHKSLPDWLTDERRAGQYFVDLATGHTRLADHGWKEFERGAFPLSAYTSVHLPAHLAATGRWDDSVSLLTDLGYIEQRVAAGQTFDLVGTYAVAIEALPESRARAQDQRRQLQDVVRWTAEITRYARTVRALRERRARGETSDMPEPALPTPPESGRIPSEEELEADRARAGSHPSRLDRIKAFASFVRAEAHNLARLGEWEGFCVQQAYNHADSGPVVDAATVRLAKGRSPPGVLLGSALASSVQPAPRVPAHVGRALEQNQCRCSVRKWSNRGLVGGLRGCAPRMGPGERPVPRYARRSPDLCRFRGRHSRRQAGGLCELGAEHMGPGERSLPGHPGRPGWRSARLPETRTSRPRWPSLRMAARRSREA